MATQRRLTRRTLIGGVILAGVALLAIGWGPVVRALDGWTHAKPAWEAGERLFIVASGLEGDSVQKRRAAARKLAENGDMAPWVVTLLLSSQVPPGDDEGEQYVHATRRHPFDLAVVAAVIGSLPEDIDRSVLVALTYLLEEEGVGVWGAKLGLIFQRHVDGESPPIRELARARLKAALGVDHEWDATAWRRNLLPTE